MSADRDRLRYLVPRPVRRGYEFFPGWGTPEVLVALAGLLAGAVLWGLGRLGGLGAAGLVAGLVVAGAGVGLALPQAVGDPLWTLARDWWRYGRRPRLWLYRWGDRF